MRPRDDLFHLIHSMTPSERRYFKLHAAQQQRGGGNQTLVLFEAIAAMDTYDEQALKDNVLHQGGIRHLPAVKHYLEELLLRVLGEYQGAESGAAELRHVLGQLEILFARGLFDNAMRRAEKGVSAALAQDQLVLALELHRWRIKLLKRMGKKGSFKELLALQLEEENLMLEMADESQLRRIHDQLFALLSQGLELPDPGATAMVDALLQRPILAQDPSGLRFNSRLIYHYIMVYAAQYRGDSAAIAFHYTEMVKVWERHPERQAKESGRYVVTLMGALECNYSSLAPPAFHEALSKIRSVVVPEPSLAARAFHLSCHLDLVYAINTGVFPATNDLEGNILRGLAEHGGLIDSGARLSFFCNLAILYFLHGRFRESQRWAQEVYQMGDQYGRKDIYDFVMSLRLVLQYELGDLDLLAYLLQSTRRNLHRRASGHPIQMAVVTHLQGILSSDATTAPKLWNAFASVLQSLSDAYTGSLAGLQALSVWTQHKLTGGAMATIIRENWSRVSASAEG